MARTYYAKLGNHVGEAYALTWAAEADARANRHSEAETLFREALACCARAGEVADSSASEILQRLAALFNKVGRNEASPITRSGTVGAGATVARAADHAEGTPATPGTDEQAPAPPPSAIKSALQSVADGFKP